jgi:replicative superfamily II helicase
MPEHPRTPIGAVLPAKYHALFRYPTLNAMQSVIAPDALRSDRNLVVSAPTASGKTGVFELALIRMLETCPGGKALFLAPLKSICSERVADWTARFAPHGVVVEELTSDSDATQPDDTLDTARGRAAEQARSIVERLQGATVIVATSEKWDVWSRMHRGTESIIGQIAILCVDEVHMIGENRGPVIECVVARMRTISKLPELSELPVARLRIVALSATIANPHTLCTWLGEAETIIHTFDSSFRPTPLEVVVNGFRCAVAARFEQDTLLPALAGTLRAHANGRPALVFFTSRQLVLDGARQLAEAGFALASAEARAAAASNPAAQRNAQLGKALRAGVGYHFSSMSADERRLVETLFLGGHLAVMCCTSGLSLGVNLPAYLVVICGTARWGGAGIGFTELSNSDVLQMAGRAGRPQFDTEGKCVLMTAETSAARYHDLLDGVQPVVSQLHLQLVEFLNAEINTASYMTSADVALSYVKDTFLYTCALEVDLRHHYQIARDADHASIDQQVQALTLGQLRRLSGAGLVEFQPESGAIAPLFAGRIMARYAVRFGSMATIVARLAADSSVEALVDMLSRCEELIDPLRRSERKALYELNRLVRYPLRDDHKKIARIGDAQLKAYVLIQAQCGGDPVPSELAAATAKVAKESVRLLVCVVELVQARGYALALVHAHMLSRCIARGVGWGDLPRKLLTQLPGVGEVLADRLAAAGVTSIATIGKLRPAQLEASCLKQPPFGQELGDKARVMPELRAWLETRSAELSVGVECVRAASAAHDPKRAYAQFQLVLGVVDDGALLLHRAVKLTSLGASATFKLKLPAAGGAALPARLRVWLLHEHFVGVDVGAVIDLPRAAPDGSQLEFKLAPLGAPPPERPVIDAIKTPPKPKPTKAPEPAVKVTSGPRAATAGLAGACAMPARARDAQACAPLPPIASHAGPITGQPTLASQGARCVPRSPPSVTPLARAGLARAAGHAGAAVAAAADVDPALDDFLDQFKHEAEDIDTPPAKLQRVGRLLPPTPPHGRQPAHRLLSGLAATSVEVSATDLIAQLRSTMAARMATPPPPQVGYVAPFVREVAAPHRLRFAEAGLHYDEQRAPAGAPAQGGYHAPPQWQPRHAARNDAWPEPERQYVAAPEHAGWPHDHRAAAREPLREVSEARGWPAHGPSHVAPGGDARSNANGEQPVRRFGALTGKPF